MTTAKNIVQRRERRIHHEKSRHRLKLGVMHQMEIDARVPAGIIDIDDLVDVEPAPLRVALAERGGR